MAFDYVSSSGYFNMYHIKMFPTTNCAQYLIINKTKVLLPQTYVTLADLGYPV
jgi:hypothetical protein